MKFIRRLVWCVLGTGWICTIPLPSRLAAAEAEYSRLDQRLPDKMLGREIHNAIVSDPTLPYCAHIVMVQVQDGVVTLRGRVHTKVEKEVLRRKAASIAGEENVVADIHYFGQRNIQRQSI